MVISAQVLLDSSNNSTQTKKISNASSLSNTANNKTTKEVSNIVDSSRSNSKTSNKKEDFKKVLDSSTKDSNSNQASRVKNDKQNNVEEKKSTDENVKELKDKIEELKEKVEENPKDDNEVNDILESLLNALNVLLELDNKSKVNNENSIVISDVAGNIADESQMLNGQTTLLDQLLNVLNSEESGSKLDSETLSALKEFMTQLQAQVSENDKVSDKTKDGINNILAKLTDMLDEASNKKVLTLEDLLKNNTSYSQNQDDSLENSSNENSQTLDSSSDNSKEEKFLKSLIQDKKDSSFDNKIGIFTGRTQNIAGQNTVQRGLTINKATFTQDLIQNVKYMSTNGLKELTVKINPGNLGQVTINLIQEDGIMKANIKANSKETTALLAQNLNEIKKQLGEQNIKISEVNIELYQEDTTFFRDGNFEGALSQEQNREKTASTKNSENNSIIENENELLENEAKINATLDFLA